MLSSRVSQSNRQRNKFKTVVPSSLPGIYIAAELLGLLHDNKRNCLDKTACTLIIQGYIQCLYIRERFHNLVNRNVAKPQIIYIEI